MFPGAGASIIRNEAGEPLGWDYPDDDGPYDPDAYLAGDYDEGDEPDRPDGMYEPAEPHTDQPCRHCGPDSELHW